jgi:hypothetical protein
MQTAAKVAKKLPFEVAGLQVSPGISVNPSTRFIT